MRVLLAALALFLLPSAAAMSVDADLPGDVSTPDVSLEVPVPETETPVVLPPLATDLDVVAVELDPETLRVASEPAGPSTSSTGSRFAAEAALPVAAAGSASLLLIVLAYAMGALEWVRQGFGWGFFSRIEDDKLLEHPARARLHATIQQNPGLPLTELCVRAGLSWGTTIHHLRRLEQGGLVVSERGRAGRMYFPSNSKESSVREAWAATSSETARRIARFVHDHPGTDQKTVCAALGLQNPAASKHLGRFEDLGLVDSHFEARHRIYTPTNELRSLVSATAA